MTVICSLIPLFGVKIIDLVDGTDLIKKSNFVWGGKEIVTSLFRSLEGTKRKRERDSLVRVWSDRRFAVCRCQNLWFMELLGNSRNCILRQFLDIFNLAGEDTILFTLAY
jgi:hypothetical protein